VGGGTVEETSLQAFRELSDVATIRKKLGRRWLKGACGERDCENRQQRLHYLNTKYNPDPDPNSFFLDILVLLAIFTFRGERQATMTKLSGDSGGRDVTDRYMHASSYELLPRQMRRAKPNKKTTTMTTESKLPLVSSSPAIQLFYCTDFR